MRRVLANPENRARDSIRDNLGRIAPLRDGPDPTRARVTQSQQHAETVLPGTAPLRYRVTLFTSRVGRSRYVDSTITTRERVAAHE